MSVEAAHFMYASALECFRLGQNKTRTKYIWRIRKRVHLYIKRKQRDRENRQYFALSI